MMKHIAMNLQLLPGHRISIFIAGKCFYATISQPDQHACVLCTLFDGSVDRCVANCESDAVSIVFVHRITLRDRIFTTYGLLYERMLLNLISKTLLLVKVGLLIFTFH